MNRNSKGQFTNEPRPERKTGIYKECLYEDCQNLVWIVPFNIGKKKYCSRKCRGLAERGIIWNITFFKKGHKTWNKGIKGENSHSWKGSNIGYIQLHKWVAMKLGKPNKCSNCRTKTSKRYEWANISHQYKRDLSDWIRLCSSCHYKYDRKNINLELRPKSVV